ncbi:hypothetical protein JZ751_029599 [Albula glossodonta]|uniref:Uncharacterized protein n=1 Tax=Albula glossodonta TaxID=121402 RepID=A0A8T2NA92_9TELE|nr:hypothetical protein JZ751_029599 [Albula glossodonta]
MFQSPETGGAVSKMSHSGEPETSAGNSSPKSKRVQLKRAGSPVPSCMSMKSDSSMDYPIKFRGKCRADPRLHWAWQGVQGSTL